jgi:nucleoside recognition membrane protein YjiH
VNNVLTISLVHRVSAYAVIFCAQLVCFLGTFKYYNNNFTDYVPWIINIGQVTIFGTFYFFGEAISNPENARKNL